MAVLGFHLERASSWRTGALCSLSTIVAKHFSPKSAFAACLYWAIAFAVFSSTSSETVPLTLGGNGSNGREIISSSG
jgi:hypothetical protein